MFRIYIKKKTYLLKHDLWFLYVLDGGQNSIATTFIIKLLDINDNCPEMKTSELETIETLVKVRWINLVY